MGLYPQPILDKTHYKMQMVYPVPNTRKDLGQCCQPFGRTTMIWGAGKGVSGRRRGFRIPALSEEELLCQRVLITSPARRLPSLCPAWRWPRNPSGRPAGHRVHAQATPFPGADRIGSQPVPLPPQIVPQRAPVDIEAIARSKLRLPPGASSSLTPPPLRIFITLKMPPASLRLLVDQAARSGAVLVLRGLKGESLRETLAVVRPLIGERHVAWLIDPEAFTRYGVHHAPTFVLALNDGAPADAQPSCISGCVAPPAFVSIAGDVSLDYALEAILRRRPDATPRIEPILKRLRAS